MLDLAILFIFFVGFLIGLKRGFVLQLIHLTGFLAAFVVAAIYYDNLAPKLTLWVPYPNFGAHSLLSSIINSDQLEHAYYRAISFAAIFFLMKILLQIVGAMLDFLANLPVIKLLNVWAGGILGFIEVYLLLFILLYIAALIPIEIIQTSLDGSVIPKTMIEHTPIFSKQIKEMWFNYMATRG